MVGLRPGARREIYGSNTCSLKDSPTIDLAYSGVEKAYALQVGANCVCVEAVNVGAWTSDSLSFEISTEHTPARTYPGR